MEHAVCRHGKGRGTKSLVKTMLLMMMRVSRRVPLPVHSKQAQEASVSRLSALRIRGT